MSGHCMSGAMAAFTCCSLNVGTFVRDKTCTRYKLEISAEKTKLMTNSANVIQREIKVKGQKLGTVTSFKILEQLSQMKAQNRRFTAALTKVKPIWRDNNISLGSKVKHSFVISIFLYACDHGH